MPSTEIIGLVGFQGSGKDTFARFLPGYKKISFADAIKDCAASFFGWDRVKLEGYTAEDRLWRETVDPWWSQRLGMPGLTPRFVLRHFGTEIFRTHFHPDFWVYIVERKIAEGGKWVVTDCRFPNEFAMLRKYGAKIGHIWRGKVPEWFNKAREDHEYTHPEIEQLHVSETAWIREEFDFTVENNGDLQELETVISDFIYAGVIK